MVNPIFLLESGGFWRNGKLIKAMRIYVFSLFGFFLLIAAILALMTEAGASRGITRIFYYLLIWFQYFIIMFCGVGMASRAVAGEKKAGTWDVLVLTSLTPFEFFVGKLMGVGLICFFQLLLGMPLLAASMCFGSFGVADTLLLLGITFVYAMREAAMALWMTGWKTRRSGAGRVLAVILGGGLLNTAFAVPFALSQSSHGARNVIAVVLGAFNPVMPMMSAMGSLDLQLHSNTFFDRFPLWGYNIFISIVLLFAFLCLAAERYKKNCRS